MKIEVEVVKGNMVIIVSKRSIKSERDKEALAKTINSMCHLHCYDPRFTSEEITEMVDSSKGSSVVFTSISGVFYVSTKAHGKTIVMDKYFEE